MELSNRILNFTVKELNHLRVDVDYYEKLKILRDVCDNIQNYVLSEIDRG